MKNANTHTTLTQGGGLQRVSEGVPNQMKKSLSSGHRQWETDNLLGEGIPKFWWHN